MADRTIVRNGVCYYRLISRPTPSKCPIHSKKVYNAISSYAFPDPSPSRHPALAQVAAEPASVSITADIIRANIASQPLRKSCYGCGSR